VNVCLENVNMQSNSGPNYFAQKLVKYMGLRGTTFESSLRYNVKLTFIESQGLQPTLPMVQRLDGIYFNANFDCDKMNYNIRKTYDAAKGVVFQTNFNNSIGSDPMTIIELLTMGLMYSTFVLHVKGFENTLKNMITFGLARHTGTHLRG